jgi:hypothetical protein
LQEIYRAGAEHKFQLNLLATWNNAEVAGEKLVLFGIKKFKLRRRQNLQGEQDPLDVGEHQFLSQHPTATRSAAVASKSRALFSAELTAIKLPAQLARENKEKLLYMAF